MDKLPQEIEVWYVIPAIRKALAVSLSKLGLKQKDIAMKLGITGAAVSQYLKNKRAKDDIFNSKINQLIENAAQRISSSSCPVKEITFLCKEIKNEKILCILHKKYSNKKHCCGVCME